MQQPRIVILFAGRFPSEKAAGLFVDLNARSLIDADADVTVVVPRRVGRGALATTPYRVAYVPTLDLSRVPVIARYANYISVALFSLSACVWLVLRSRKTDVVISNDTVPLIVASLVRRNLMYEMHDFADRSLWMYRVLFRRIRWILATNEWKRDKLVSIFGVKTEKIVLERNAVDTKMFGAIEKADARRALGLEASNTLVVYTGHLYEWKGADTLAKAATKVPHATFIFVGGTAVDTARFRDTWGAVPNIRIVGHVPHGTIPVWQSAADVLVLPNSAKEEISVHYTSPMKLFEYMASTRAIVASDLPSIREVLTDEAGYFAKPDDAESFAKTIERALTDVRSSEKASAARRLVEDHSWKRRAERILRATI